MEPRIFCITNMYPCFWNHTFLELYKKYVRFRLYVCYDEGDAPKAFYDKNLTYSRYSFPKYLRNAAKFVWKISNGNWRYDLRFAHKYFALYSMISTNRFAYDTYFVWIDNDIKFIAPFSDTISDIVKTMEEEKYAVAYLGRKNFTPECGFMVFSPYDGPVVINFIYQQYKTLSVLNEQEFHDSYLFQEWLKNNNVKALNLTPDFVVDVNNPNLDVFEYKFGKFAKHLKGNLKHSKANWE